MNAAEKRISDTGWLNGMEDLAVALGAPSCSIESINQTVVAKWGWVHARVALIPYPETWQVRFLRTNGGWVVTGQRLGPQRGNRIPGFRLPRHVRVALPVRKDGRLPASLAPRRCDLPRVVDGRWYGTSPKSRIVAPYVVTTVQAYAYGVAFFATGNPNGPRTIMFPAPRADVTRHIKELAAETQAAHLRREADGWEKRRSRGHARGPEQPGADVLPVREPEAVRVL